MYKNKLKDLRIKNNKTKEDIAKLLDIDRTTYTHYEFEDDIIPIKSLLFLSRFYEVSLDYIFSFTNISQYDSALNETNYKCSGKRLKEFRKEEKLTLKDLASIINCSYGTIAGYESGRYLIATPFLYEICKKYKISADYLLGKTDEPKYLK